MKTVIFLILALTVCIDDVNASLELGNSTYSSSGNYLDVIVKYKNETGRGLTYVEITCTALNNNSPVGQGMTNKLNVAPGYQQWLKASIRVNNQDVDYYECQVTEER